MRQHPFDSVDPVAPELTRRRWLHLASALASSLPFAGPARADAGTAKVALVIGNAAYASVPLRNPVRDALAMAELLARLGFQVIEERDADRSRMDAAIERATAALRGRQGIALLYYAGHGVQIDWHNYLLPVDVRIDSSSDVAKQCVDVQRVLAAFRGVGARMNILVLDACRDNPFGASGLRGLAPMDAPPGTFFAYATAPGNVAEDGSAEGNGLYTRFLLQELPKPDARIEDIFKRVRLQVRQATRGRQVPWESTSLEEDFVFVSGERAPAPVASAREREFEAERQEWELVRRSTRAEDFYAFLERHPRGPFSELAQFSLDRLARPLLVEQAPQALQQVTMLPPGVDRYKLGDEWQATVTDHLAGNATQHRRARVTAIEGTRVVVSDGRLILDQMGNVIVNDTGRKDPGILFVPAQVQVGKRWRSAFTNYPPDGGASERNFYDHHVAALEDIEVPAGKFRVFRIESRGEAVRWNGGTRMESTLWVDPQTMWAVRNVTRFSELHRNWPLRHTTSELTRINRVPR